MSIAVYPGSFDPITLGHLDIIKRAAPLFDELFVCVMINSGKAPFFSLEERKLFIERTTTEFPNVKVEASEELLVNYMRNKGARVIIKGLRAMSDFDREFQLALVNRKLNPDFETLFLPSSEEYTFLSSSIVKEMARYGADLQMFVPTEIIGDLLRRAEHRNGSGSAL